MSLTEEQRQRIADEAELAEARAWAEELGLPDPEEQERTAELYGCPPGGGRVSEAKAGVDT